MYSPQLLSFNQNQLRQWIKIMVNVKWLMVNILIYHLTLTINHLSLNLIVSRIGNVCARLSVRIFYVLSDAGRA